MCIASSIPAFVQEEKPLGDVARETRASKSSSPGTTKVITNDDISPSVDQRGTNDRLPDKQAYCEGLSVQDKQQAEKACAALSEALSIEMGPDYESLVSRELELGKTLCGAGGGKGLPTSEPADSQAAARYRQWDALGERFGELWNLEKKNLEREVLDLNEARERELKAAAPDLNNPAALAANKQESERYLAISNKYAQLATAAERRLSRFFLDWGRLESVCDSQNAAKAEASKSPSPRPTKVITDDDIRSAEPHAAQSGLSPDKQAYCDWLHRDIGSLAERKCSLLAIDLGPEYESEIARDLEVGTSVLCDPRGPAMNLSKDPADQKRLEDYRNMKLQQSWNAALDQVGKGYAILDQDKNREMQAEFPGGWRYSDSQSLRRLQEIDDKYKSLRKPLEDRQARIDLDMERFRHVCDSLQRAGNTSPGPLK